MTAILEKLSLYWAYPFVRYALVVGVLIALCSSLLGGTLVLGYGSLADESCASVGETLKRVCTAAWESSVRV